MASVRREVVIDARPQDVWDALRDFGAVHERLARGFVVDTVLDGAARIVTFHDGSVAREPLVDLDDDARRLVWTVVGGQASHYHASAQVFAEGADRTRFVWVADVLPNELASPLAGLMEQGLAAIKRTLEAPTVP